MINEITGNGGGIEYLPRRRWDTKMRILGSYEKAQKQIGYQPNTKFEEGLKKTIEWFNVNWDKITEAAKFGPGTSSAVRHEVVKAGAKV